MKSFLRKYGVAILMYIIVLALAYQFQQTLTFKQNELIEFSRTFKQLELKKEKHKPAKFYFEGDNNIYVLKRSAYKAWTKHSFLETAKKGDLLSISILKKYSSKIGSKKRHVIGLVAMHNQQNGHTYLTLQNYNNHQIAGMGTVYLVATFFLFVYILVNNIGQKSYHLKK